MRYDFQNRGVKLENGKYSTLKTHMLGLKFTGVFEGVLYSLAADFVLEAMFKA